ncbi:MAG: hypothetical protein EHM35_01915 [Planctomycetaceae bacterium]|nr:MAG: hypothetical protein EHM35_01915 [Planctomycetaceae bacterium]
MNSTQKVAWIFLSSVLMGGIVFVYVGSIFVLGHMPPSPFGRIGPAAAVLIPLLVLGLIILFITRRQSPAEPEADERDKTIMSKAVVASFVTGWLLLGVVLLILGLALGQTGSVPVYLLTLILWGVAMITMLTYGVAILVQYGRTEKESDHE